MSKRMLIIAVGALVALAIAPSTASANTVTAQCNGGPCVPWVNTDVSLHWAFDTEPVPPNPCPDPPPFTTEGQYPASCTATWNMGEPASATVGVTIGIDKTKPVVTGATPSGTAWFTSPMSFTFVGTDARSGISSCETKLYNGPDSANASVTGTCTDNAGNVSDTGSHSFKYDAAAPTVTGAAADRPPDHGGYYNHPVTFAFTGTDATSGIQSCDRVTYSGPDDSTAHVTGSCHDNAGNINIRSFEFKYDGTKPRSPKLVATPGSKRVDLSWTDTDATSFVVTRSVVGGGAVTQTAYSGSGSNFVDTHVRNGVRYIYTVTGTDSAGNTSSAASIRAIPTASSLRPFAGTAVGSAPLLTWKKVKRARYYNVQLWRGGKKVLTAWPGRASFQVPQRWRFKGRRYSISSGHYRWWVWPGYGPRSAHRYGKALGTSSFRLRA